MARGRKPQGENPASEDQGMAQEDEALAAPEDQGMYPNEGKLVRVQMLRTGSPGGGAMRFAGREYEVDAKLAEAMIAARDAKKV